MFSIDHFLFGKKALALYKIDPRPPSLMLA
jgi:hypothetical protein